MSAQSRVNKKLHNLKEEQLMVSACWGYCLKYMLFVSLSGMSATITNSETFLYPCLEKNLGWKQKL